MRNQSTTTADERKARRLAAALALVPQHRTWNTGRSKRNGVAFYVIPSRSEPGVAHWTAKDGRGCTCKGHRARGYCAHTDAVKLLASARVS